MQYRDFEYGNKDWNLQAENSDPHKPGAGMYGQGCGDGLFHDQCPIGDAGGQSGAERISGVLSLAVKQSGETWAVAREFPCFFQKPGKALLCAPYLGCCVVDAVTVAGDNGFNVQHAAHHGGDQADAAALAQVGQGVHVIEDLGILYLYLFQ